MKNKGKVVEGAGSAALQSSVLSKSDAATSPAEGGSAGKKSALKVLKKCAIFVDVRTDDGDDAGSLFVDMLRGLGARVSHKVLFSSFPLNTCLRYSVVLGRAVLILYIRTVQRAHLRDIGQLVLLGVLYNLTGYCK
jgi:hypothetical protein